MKSKWLDFMISLFKYLCLFQILSSLSYLLAWNTSDENFPCIFVNVIGQPSTVMPKSNTLWTNPEKNSNGRNNGTKVQDNASKNFIRIGREFQAKIPNVIPVKDRNILPENTTDVLLWNPTNMLTDEEISEFISKAKEHRYSEEQALGFLYLNKYDCGKAASDYKEFSPRSEEWTREDKILVENAFRTHGKSFGEIQKMLPNKTISDIFQYYYNWKATKNNSNKKRKTK